MTEGDGSHWVMEKSATGERTRRVGEVPHFVRDDRRGGSICSYPCNPWLVHLCFLLSEHEISRTDQTKTGPEIIEFDRLMHVEQSERDEHGQGNDFL